MATKFKRNGFWYVKYKDIDGKWKNVACGVKAKGHDAEYIRKEYDARELNYRHKAPVRIMDVALLEALRKFKEEVLPGEEKARSSVKREQAVDDIKIHKKNEIYVIHLSTIQVPAFCNYLILLLFFL